MPAVPDPAVLTQEKSMAEGAAVCVLAAPGAPGRRATGEEASALRLLNGRLYHYDHNTGLCGHGCMRVSV